MPTHQSLNEPNAQRYGAGGRAASEALRYAQSLTEDFSGLEEGVDRYGLLLLAKRTGKLAGFTPRMLQLLEYYLAFTRDVDWEAGGRPVVFQTLSRTALDLGVSERQVQKLEAALFAAGAIGWNDSGNHRRYGHRCLETGRIVYAFGVDLTPLAYLRDDLQAKLEEKREHDEAWMRAKRGVSALRREFRGLIAEWEHKGKLNAKAITGFVARYGRIAVPIRTHLNLAALHSLVAEHEALVSDLRDAMGIETPQEPPTRRPSTAPETQKRSPRSEPEFAHYKYTTHYSIDSSSPRDPGFQGSVAEGPATDRATASLGPAAAMEHVTLGMTIGAASERLAFHLQPDPSWRDLVEAAYQVRVDLGISQASWGEACSVLGRNGAAVCLLVADRAALREVDPVRTPPAYFRGMVRRAERGELRLCRSLFGLLQRERDGGACAA